MLKENTPQTAKRKREMGLAFSLFLIGIAIGLLLFPAVQYPYILLWVLLFTSFLIMAFAVSFWRKEEES